MDRLAATLCLVRQLERPLLFVDVGARWGVAPAWQAFGDAVSVVCFEPDTVAELQQKLAAEPPVADNLAERLAAAEDQLARMQSSPPLRMTAPLRAISTMFGDKGKQPR